MHGHPDPFGRAPQTEADAEAIELGDQGAARARIGAHRLQRGWRQQWRPVGGPSVAHVEPRIAELLARTGDQAAVGMPVPREIPELGGKDGAVVDHAVAAGDRVARQLIGEIPRAAELERIEQ